MPIIRVGVSCGYRPAGTPRGIILDSALWILCRCRHKTHWTGHEQRLNRSFDSKRFGDDGYAIEELTAELGAAFLCADLGITPEVMPEHASYLSAWLKVLKADTKALFTAASHASRAADYLHGLQPNAEPEETAATE